MTDTEPANVAIGVTLDRDDVNILDRLAYENDHSRSSFARSIIRRALKAERARSRRAASAEAVA